MRNKSGVCGRSSYSWVARGLARSAQGALLLGHLATAAPLAEAQDAGLVDAGTAVYVADAAAPDSQVEPVAPPVVVEGDPAPEAVVEGDPLPEVLAVEGEPMVAGDAASDVANSADTIVVTAQFREQNPQKTPLALTVTNAEMMQARGQVTVVDVANTAPNVKLSPGPGTFGPSLQAYIRGVGQHDFNFALEPGVGVYVDDVYFATLTGSVLDLLDLERVEILRGPQGTLAGQNSIGGAIKLYSKKPQGGNTGFVQTTYGRFNRAEVRTAGDFTLIPDKLFGRISGVANHSDGYVTRYDYACTHPGSGVSTYQISDKCKLGTEGGKSYAAMRGALRWLPTDDIEVNLSGDFTKDNSEATPQTLLYVGNPMGPGAPNATNTMLNGVPLGTPTGSQFISYTKLGNYALDTFSNSPYTNYSTYTDPSPQDGSAPYSVPPVYRVDSGGASLRVDVALPHKLSLANIAGYREYSGSWSVDEGTPVGAALLHNVVSNRQFTEELRLGGKLFNGAVDFTVGGFYLWRKSHYGGRISLRTVRFVEDSDIPAQGAAGFANVEWHITDALDAVVGARYSWQKKEFTYGRAFVQGVAPNPGLSALDGTVGKFEGDRGDYRGALQYQWIPELMTYAQIATGFKGGGVNPRPFVPDQALPHDPETLLAYEIGAKSDWLDSRVRLNASAFFNQYNDILMTVTMCPGSAPTPCFMPINAGKAHVAGFELETLVYPLKLLGIDGSLSYLNFSYDSISALGRTSGITLNMTGPYAPQWQASGGARYHFLFGSWGSLTPRIDLIYQDSYHTNPNNSRFDVVPERLLLNGRLTWASADDSWQAALELTNLTNRLYYYNVRDDRGSSNTVTGQPAPPRQWAVSLKRSFF